MSVRRLREATQASPRFQVAEPASAMSESEHEYLRQHVDPVLMPLIEALLLYQPEHVDAFIMDYVDERQSPRLRFSLARSGKLAARRSMVEFMASSVIPVMDDLARQILRARPPSVRGFIRDAIAARGGREPGSGGDHACFRPGDAVLCRHKGRPRLVRGVVTAVEAADEPDALFTVELEDGTVAARVPAAWLTRQDAPDSRSPSPSPSRPPSAPGSDSPRSGAVDNQVLDGAVRPLALELEDERSAAAVAAASMEVVLLLLGVDGAGKTTLLSTLQGEPDKEHVPSAGFSSAAFALDAGRVTFYDLGGGPAFRDVWPEYYADAHGVVFVVDSAAESAVQEAAAALHRAMAHDLLADKPLLVLANKRDLPTALPEPRVHASLGIERLAAAKCVPCVAKRAATGGEADARLEPALEWLLRQVRTRLDVLQARVERDLARKRLADQRRRDEQRARVASWREERERQHMARHDRDGHEAGAVATADATAPAAADVIYCCNCATEPAATKCAASKWMPVCAPCAEALRARQ